MGRIDAIVPDDIETRFRNSIPGLKKGDISKKITSLILKDLGETEKDSKKENRRIDLLVADLDKLALKIYNKEGFCMEVANKFALEWDKIKQKHNLLRNQKI